MNIVDFPGTNTVIGKGQEDIYNPIPAIKIPGEEGEFIYCVEFTEDEAEEFLKTRRIFVSQWTFNKRFNPIRFITSLDDGIFIIPESDGPEEG